MGQRKQTPTVRLRRLAAELRRLRTEAGLTRDEVSDQTGINSVTLYRIETAKARPQGRTLTAMLTLYGTADDERAQLVALSKNALTQGWLQPFHAELSEEYTAYISFEAEAKSIRSYGSLFVPGLLQTEDYARAVIRGTMPKISNQEVEDRVRARMERQALLAADKPLTLWAIVDEAALHRDVGGAAAMRGQIKRLAEAAEQPNITLQVISFASGAHPGMPGSFVLLGFADPVDTDLIYIESIGGDLFLESGSDVATFTDAFDHLRAVAKSPADTTKRLTQLAKQRE
ncbi:helix-turn-helix domain-containing protein [Actinokineospora inagensis]|uniref:helix-turn-helix domain-containing protein n=1 Tax=Actinokineospora inagensis TaxID=103730 RepID=UPI0004273DD0|nr:helix-turn-helix transcriptional regulator [Actinokineospora inagensis]